MRLVVLLVACLVLAAPALASDPVVIKDIPKFLDYQRDLRDDIKRDSKFKHVDNSSRERLYAAQDTLFTLLDGKQSIDQLTPEQLTQVYNAQSEIAAVVADADLDRPVCRREKRIGSNMMTTVCTTKREIEARRQANMTERLRTRACSGPECAGN